MTTSARVLLVDDEVEFLEPVAARLHRRGLDCSSVTGGEQALAALGGAAFDCAIVDVRMPGMDGLELLRQVRRRWPQVSVILLTGHASIELGVKGMELGAFEYLLKPVDIDDLVDTVLRATRPR